MELKDLQVLIEKNREELDKLVATNLSNLCADKVLKISNELDSLIAIYISLKEN